jgi:hypothetical protein
MENHLNNSIQIKLQKQEAAINDRLNELEMRLLLQKEDTQSEIDEYLKKQEDISMTMEYLDALQGIEEDVELRLKHLKEEEKSRARKYKMTRKSRLESWISDYKQGAVRTKGTSSHDSYIDNVHYYQKQLSSLISSLE